MARGFPKIHPGRPQKGPKLPRAQRPRKGVRAKPAKRGPKGQFVKA
jgi:hypothetical protein